MRLFAEHISPTVRHVLAHKLRPHARAARDQASQDNAELHNTVHLNLLKRLRELKDNPGDSPIRNLRGYVVTSTVNAYDEHLRRRYPRRRHLHDRLRYHLGNEPGLALWQDADSGWVAGFSAEGVGGGGTVSALIPPETGELVERTRVLLRPTDPLSLSLPELIRAVLRAAGSPLALSRMLSAVADLQHVHDLPAESYEEGGAWEPASGIGGRADLETLAERHQLVERLWEEICRLPRRHRVALLFNLRGEGGISIIMLLPVTGVATFEQIAAALEIPTQQFEPIWSKLPMDDLSIAAYLGATRQQVINLRKNARGRLQRLMVALEAGVRRP